MIDVLFIFMGEKPKLKITLKEFNKLGILSKWLVEKNNNVEIIYPEKKIKWTQVAKEKPAGMKYHEFIKSKTWKIIRDNAKKDVKYRCECCGTYKNLTVHHCRYVKRGTETFKDLVVLCWNCHRGVHNLVINEKIKLKKAHFVYKQLKELGDDYFEKYKE